MKPVCEVCGAPASSSRWLTDPVKGLWWCCPKHRAKTERWGNRQLGIEKFVSSYNAMKSGDRDRIVEYMLDADPVLVGSMILQFVSDAYGARPANTIAHPYGIDAGGRVPIDELSATKKLYMQLVAAAVNADPFMLLGLLTAADDDTAEAALTILAGQAVNVGVFSRER